MSSAMHSNMENTVSENDILTVSELERDNAKEIWVLNTSIGKIRGTVQFQVLNNQGNHVHIEIPYTFVAVNLTEFSSASNILNADAFRRAVGRRLLTIVTPEYARKLNSSKMAQAELETISRGVSVGVAESADTILGGGELDRGSRSRTQINTSASVGLLEQEAPIDANLVIDSTISGIMRNSSLSAIEKLNMLRTNRKLIKPVDAYYIQAVANLDEDDDEADQLVEASAKILNQFRAKYSKVELKAARRAAKNYLDNI